MHRARAFFYVCAGVFLLALSYHLGARSAGAQASGHPVVAVALSGSVALALTSAGESYRSTDAGDTWALVGHVFGGPTPAQRESFGSMKARYRSERGAAQPAPQSR